jgi:hypothetical protein
MCGWARGPAGWFGNCGAYSQKSPPIIVNGPSALQTKGDLYTFGLRRFVESLDQDDKDEFDKLFAEGWRLRTENACNLLLWKNITPNLVMALDRFAKEKIVCDGEEGPAHIFSRISGCLRDLDFGPNGKLAAIDRWNILRPSRALRDSAERHLKAYRLAQTAKADELAELCIKRHGPEAGKLPQVELRFIDSVFSFTESCKREVLDTIGLPVIVSVR